MSGIAEKVAELERENEELRARLRTELDRNRQLRGLMDDVFERVNRLIDAIERRERRDDG